MDIRQLRYFVAIAEEGTITKAAQSLHMAQPPLSKQLKLMEDELGVILFERNKKKKVTLTPQGEFFLKKAKAIIHSLEEAIIEVKELGEEICGTLSIGSTIYCAPYMLKKLNQFRCEHPQVKFNIWEGSSTVLFELLEERSIDIAIATGPFPKDNIEIKKLDIDPCVLVVPNNYDLEVDFVSVETISTLPLLLLQSEQGIGVYYQIINEFQRRNLEPNILCECHDSAMLLNLVSTGFGVSILPASMVSSKIIGNFKTFPIKENPWVLEPALIWKSNRYLPAYARKFLQLT